MKVALVVDDSMLIRHTVCRFLEQRGFAVHAAVNGADAATMLAELTPDLVVTDLEMPKMSGSELITVLKSNARLAETPIIVLAARRTASDPQQMDQRADAIVHKDIDIIDELSTALNSILTSAK